MTARVVLLLATLLIAATSSVCAAVNVADLLGKTMPPYPDGCKPLGGSLVGPGVQRSLTTLQCGKAHFELFSDAIHRDEKRVYFRVRTAHRYPAPPPGYRITSERHCSDDKGENDPLLIAIVRWKDKKDGQYASPVLHAWRVDLDSGRFNRVDVGKVRCSFFWP